MPTISTNLLLSALTMLSQTSHRTPTGRKQGEGVAPKTATARKRLSIKHLRAARF